MQSVLQSPAPESQQLEDRSEGVDVDAKLLELGLDPSDFNRYYNPPVDRCQSISRVLLDDFRQAIGNDRVDLETALFEWEIKRGPFFITHLLCARIGKWPFISYQFTQPAFKDLQNVESKLREISDWILPSLYGALGAVLFSLSRVLSALSPNPPFNRFMIRLMAGAFAGFATVKFFTPDVASSVGLGWLVSFGQLLLAFLAGYAVESLLKLLTDGVSRVRLTWAVPDRAARRTTDGNDKLFEP